MKRIFCIGFYVACLAMLGVTHRSQILCRGFLPENNLQIPAGFKDQGLTQAEWTLVLDKYENIYDAIVASKGGTLKLNRLWDDATVNANAGESHGLWTINLYGGMARYPNMTADALALVVCHETGHHLGGAPRWYNDPDYWSTNEGGADYFATLKCARRLFAADDNKAIISKMNLDPNILSTCSAQYSDENESAICVRTASAALILGDIMAKLEKDSVVPAFMTPDPSVVSDTVTDDYPGPQCRLDTYLQGGLCKASIDTFQDRDYHTGSCTEPQFKVGLRPKCWFKADDADHVVNQ